MRKPRAPDVVIDNSPHPPIVLAQPRPRPKRICGVMVIRVSSWPNELCVARGSYFSSTKAASRRMGFDTDRVGQLLRKNRGTKIEGYALFPEVWFISAKAAMRFRYRRHEFLLRDNFPWAFPPDPPMKMIFLPKGHPECVRWVPIEEPETTSTSEPKTEEPSVRAQSETILDYVI